MQYLRQIFVVVILSAACGCSAVTQHIPIHDPVVIGQEPVDLLSEWRGGALRRHKSRASLRLQIEEKWQPISPWNDIQLSDLGMAGLKIEAVTEDGNVIVPSTVGFAGGLINIRFDPQLSSDNGIVRILVKADHDLTLQKILWVNWDAL